MRVLVTGGAGFIGSHVAAALLARGDEVEILDSFDDYYDPRLKRERVARLAGLGAVHEADLRNRDTVRRIVEGGRFDAIIHLAAKAGVRPSILNPRLYIEMNIVGTLNLLEAARDGEVGRFLFASSSSVYGLAGKEAFREEMPLHQTLSPYGATKVAGEQLCGNFSYLYGMRCVSLRFFTVYGPGQRPDLAIHKFTNAIWRGLPIEKFGGGDTSRDYTYIDDIVDGVLRSLAYEGPLYDVFNLGGGRTTCLDDLIAAIEACLGKKALITQLPLQPGDMPTTYADITKARRLLGYNPGTTLTQGIKKFTEWYLADAKAQPGA